jgi:hypothetical protein
VGLPPLHLRLPLGTPAAPCDGPLARARRLSLTDGGVLENLGAQTLLQSSRFATWDMVVSDAGVREAPWTASPLTPLRSLVISLLSAGTLERILTVMNDKENRSMRTAIVREVEATWVAEVAVDASREAELAEYMKPVAAPRRRLCFTRMDQTRAEFLVRIPRWRWIELGVHPRSAAPSLDEALGWLSDARVDVGPAGEMYDELGGDDRVAELNRIATNFTALRGPDIRDLARHARWQVHLAHAVYG